MGIILSEHFYTAIDPGVKNGICTYDEHLKMTSIQVVQLDKLMEFLEGLQDVNTCIYETFRLYPNKAKQQIYSSMETPRAIGRIESWAYGNGIKLIGQPASDYPMGFRYLGEKIPPKSDVLSHAKVAHAHFVFWAVKHGKMKPEDLV